MAKTANNMGKQQKFWNGFFWALGFGNPPNSEEVIEIAKQDSTESVKNDLNKIKKDLKKSYRDLVFEIH